MSLLKYFRSKKGKGTASTAKERLQIIVAHERGERGVPDYLPQMRQDILDIIRKYVHIEQDQISIHLDQKNENISVMELNIMFPETEGPIKKQV